MGLWCWRDRLTLSPRAISSMSTSFLEAATTISVTCFPPQGKWELQGCMGSCKLCREVTLQPVVICGWLYLFPLMPHLLQICLIGLWPWPNQVHNPNKNPYRMYQLNTFWPLTICLYDDPEVLPSLFRDY